MTSFSTLKKSSANIDRLTKEIEKNNLGGVERGGDNRYWTAEVDKSGNGMAIIRFLPAPSADGEDALPWVRIFSHGFKGPTGKWYIENSLTTLSQKDPVSEYNSKLWNETSDDSSPQRKQARIQKRRLNYISNIMVVSDPKHPENEGKIFLFKYGKKIFDKITQVMNPEFEGDTPVNPFDFWKGANLKLRIRNVEGYRNYDMSAFEASAALSKEDAILETIWNKEHSLKTLVSPDNFKSYAELARRLNDVLESNVTADPVRVDPRVAESSSPKTDKTETPPWKAEDEDEDLDYFKKLADA